MNALVTAAPRLPTMSPQTARLVAFAAEHGATASWTQGEKDIAAIILDRCVEAFKPAPREVIDNWLFHVVAGTRNRPVEADYSSLLNSIYFGCGDLPAACWSSDTAKEACRKLKFRPSPADIYELLEPHADEITRMIKACRTITGGPLRPPPARPVTPEQERAYIASTVRPAVQEAEEGPSNVLEGPWRPPPSDDADQAHTARYEALAANGTDDERALASAWLQGRAKLAAEAQEAPPPRHRDMRAIGAINNPLDPAP